MGQNIREEPNRNMTKVCTRCHTVTPLDRFSRSSAASDGYHAWCKACKAASTRAWQAANRDRLSVAQKARYAADGTRKREQAKRWHHENRPRSLESKRWWKLSIYGLTPDDYSRILEQQGGACAICRAPANRNKAQRDFAVDHCHETRLVRGLLCHHCNVGIGHFSDRADLLRAAAYYVEMAAAKRPA